MRMMELTQKVNIEGLMIKSGDSEYLVNDSRKAWVKFKNQNLGDFGDSLDLIPIGAFYG